LQYFLYARPEATNYPLGNRRHACHEPSLLELCGVNAFAEIEDHVLAV
jgi:hypothetical protein